MLNIDFKVSLSFEHIFLFGTEKSNWSMHEKGGGGGGGGVDILVKIDILVKTDILVKIDIFCQDLGFDFIKTIFLTISSKRVDYLIKFMFSQI